MNYFEDDGKSNDNNSDGKSSDGRPDYNTNGTGEIRAEKKIPIILPKKKGK